MGNYFDWANFGTGAQQRYTSQPAWHSGEMENSFEQGTQQGTDLFRQQFKAMLGRDPTADELGQYQLNALASALPNGTNPGYGDLSGLASSYVQNTFGQEAAKHQQDLQTTQLDKSQTSIQDLINKTMGNTATALSDPNSKIYQTLAGGMNNMGITPGSGAFQAGAGSTIANAGLDAGNNALQQIGIPGIQSIAGLTAAPYQQASYMGNHALGNLENIGNFNMQADLARQLGMAGQPSTLQSILGMASSSAQGAGSFMQGAGTLRNSTPSYVCREMEKRGLICASDLEDFYLHLFDGVWYKARAFWHYKRHGEELVERVNAKGLDWAVFKPLLFDRVMEEPDACKAIDLYIDGCHQLCISAAPWLWDERVMRTSILDSLRFLPFLFTDATFGKNFWRILRVKTMFLYDKPRCAVHR